MLVRRKNSTTQKHKQTKTKCAQKQNKKKKQQQIDEPANPARQVHHPSWPLFAFFP